MVNSESTLKDLNGHMNCVTKLIKVFKCNRFDYLIQNDTKDHHCEELLKSENNLRFLDVEIFYLMSPTDPKIQSGSNTQSQGANYSMCHFLLLMLPQS